VVNSFIAYIYYQQLNQMRIATEASTKAVNLASDTLQYNASQFDRAMQQTVSQTVSQYQGTQESIVAANAAKSAANTANDALHISERAYLSTQNPVFNFVTSTIDVSVANSGHIPSGPVETIIFEATYDITVPIDTSNVPIEAHWRRISLKSIPVGLQYQFPVTAFSMEKDKIEAGKQQVSIAGTIFYNDGFTGTAQREWPFCVISRFDAKPNRTLLIPCDPTVNIPILKKTMRYPNHEEH
jgi:hypothetical protein